jgi:hypothetical protein
LHPGRSGSVKALRTAPRMPRLSGPQDLELYSSRLDEAAEYLSILRDFEYVRDEALGAERAG